MKSSYIVGLFGILVIFTSFYYFRNISWNQNYIPKIKNHTLLERFARARSMELLLPLQTATKWSWLKSRIAFSSTAAAAASFSGGWPACFLLLLLLLPLLTSGGPAAAAPVSWYQLTWQSSPFRRARLSSERLSEIFRYTSVSSSSSLLKISSLEFS